MSYIIVDCEATGRSPYSGLLTSFGACELMSMETFHGVLWETEPHPTIPAIPVITGQNFDEKEIFVQFETWIRQYPGNPIFVSDNPAFDWQWISFYADKYLGENPFGHTARRIGDFAAGLERDWRQTSNWKKRRRTPHDHNPVHDAIGNAESLAYLLRQAKKNKGRT